jgi:folate-binding protein YgfZ
VNGSPFLQLPGAVTAPAPDEAVPGHYGEPLREQRRLDEGAGLVDRGNRGVIRVAGPDRLGWLHSLTTQHLDNLAPFHPVEALVLSPHGHIEHHFHLIDDGEAAWLDVEPGTATGLARYLESMRFMLRVEVADLTAEFAVLTVSADGGGEPAGPLPGGGLWRRRSWPSWSVDRLVPRSQLAGLAARPPRPVCGISALEALRIARRVPRLGFETDHRTIPNELGWLATAVHLDKGCYRGQETVAKVHNLGRPPRRLVLLHLDGTSEELPARGTPVEVEGRAAGAVTSAAWHYELGPICLAMVKRSVPDEAAVTVGAFPAAIDLPAVVPG